jgi:hypothetical protein
MALFEDVFDIFSDSLGRVFLGWSEIGDVVLWMYGTYKNMRCYRFVRNGEIRYLIIQNSKLLFVRNINFLLYISTNPNI